MGIQMKECCVNCDAYTERAGKHDDSLKGGSDGELLSNMLTAGV